MQKKVISLEKFATLAPNFSNDWEYAKKVFKVYGDHLSVQTASVLYIAAEKKVLKTVLDKMWTYFNEYLKYQRSNVRGLDDQKTVDFFKKINEQLSAIKS